MTYIALLPLSEVVREVLSDVLDKVVGVLRVQVQNLIQSPEINALQITICQCFHVCTCLYHPVFHRQVGPNQVPFTCICTHV